MERGQEDTEQGRGQGHQAGKGEGGEEQVGGHNHGGQEDQLVLRHWQPLHNNSSLVLPPQDGQTSQTKYNHETMGLLVQPGREREVHTKLVTEKGARKYIMVYIMAGYKPLAPLVP